jgi:tetratricopeptide (TPR) repeat protein
MEEAFDLMRVNGIPGTATLLFNLGRIAISQEDYSRAESLLTEGLAVAQAKGDKLSLTIICKQLAELAENRGDNRGAKASYTQSLHIARELGKKSSIADALTDLSRMAFQEGDAATARSLMLDSLALFREVGITFSMVDSLVFLARYALAQDEHATAYAYLAESLSLSVEAAYPWGLVSSLENFAVLIAARMRNDLTIGVRSTRLWAKAAALREQHDLSLSAPGQEQQEHAIQPLRSHLGEDAWAAAWTEGRAMTMEQAVKYALSEADVTSS